MDGQTLAENVLSLLKEHGNEIRTRKVDHEDMADLVTGLSISVKMMIEMGENREFEIVAVVTPYIKAAYGLGLARGQFEGAKVANNGKN